MLNSRKNSAAKLKKNNHRSNFDNSLHKTENSSKVTNNSLFDSIKFSEQNLKKSRSKFNIPANLKKNFNPNPRPYWAGQRFSNSTSDCEKGAGASKSRYEDILIEGSGFASFYDRLDRLNAKLR